MKDGSWENEWSEPNDDAYSKLHPIWVGTQCLRDRAFTAAEEDPNRATSKLWQVRVHPIVILDHRTNGVFCQRHVEQLMQETKIWGDPDKKSNPAPKKKKKKKGATKKFGVDKASAGADIRGESAPVLIAVGGVEAQPEVAVKSGV